MSLKARITLYSLALSFAVFGTIFCFMSSIIDGFSPYLYIFGKISGSVATLTWIWISVLLSYNNRPLSTHSLTRSSAHFFSFAVFSLIWLALGIILSTQLALECNFVTYSDGSAYAWCSLAGTATGLAFLVSIISTASAVIIYLAAQKSGAGLAVNVAQGDKTDDTV